MIDERQSLLKFTLRGSRADSLTTAATVRADHSATARVCTRCVHDAEYSSARMFLSLNLFSSLQ
jgi:hypothetical protein